ncbi:MAG: type II toxin-antitoxin system RelE/ParE family toxin [Symploca sp. SIO2B6]|nr:type II toxin-antitoxin system RelE/ParE family toxin [Symploca sp. SIO2B6]
MIEVRQTKQFANWFKGLRDRRAKVRVQARIDRVELGNFGDTKSVGNSVYELPIPYGPGYRVYYVRQGTIVVVLLAGGDKSSQIADIKKAKQLAQQLED